MQETVVFPLDPVAAVRPGRAEMRFVSHVVAAAPRLDVHPARVVSEDRGVLPERRFMTESRTAISHWAEMLRTGPFL